VFSMDTGVPGGRPIFCVVIVLVILKRNIVSVRVLLQTVSETEVFHWYSCKIVDKKEMLRTVSNISIYHSSDEVGTVYLVKYIFENSTININALCNSREDRACCSS